MKETEKYYPCGAMRPEYVEELIDNLILPDKERLIEKLARENGFVYSSWLNILHCFTIYLDF